MGRDEKHLFVGKKLGLSESDIPDFTSVAGQVVLLQWMKEDWPEFEFDLRKISSDPTNTAAAIDAAYEFLISR